MVFISSFAFCLFIATESLKKTWPLKENRTAALDDFPSHETLIFDAAYFVVSPTASLCLCICT